jgi:FtsP/CotA-like multicopper oxidase with cupredoxin domain
VAERGTPTEVTWVNDLGTVAGSGLAAWKTATDQTLHWADPLGDGHLMTNYGWDPNLGDWTAAPIPAVVHLHGGEVPPQLDGGPDAWYVSDGTSQGHAYYTKTPGTDPADSAVYNYPNSQEAANIWFHDHVLGITRLNVYAGLAGGYLLSDPDQTLPTGLTPHGLGSAATHPLLGDEPIVPLVIQDRSFDMNGELFFPNLGINPEHPFWIPEFEGDTIVINGKVWPFLNVEPKRYRFLFLNGSNARTYEMFLVDRNSKVMGPPMWVIGTDGGYLDQPVLIDPNAPKPATTKLVMMPGERYDVIIDFAGLAPGTQLLLRNVAKTPFPNGVTPQGNTIGQVMQINVVAGTGAPDPGYDPATGPALRSGSGAIERLAPAATTPLRRLTLNEVMGAGGPLEVLVNNTKWGGSNRNDFVPFPNADGSITYYTELPEEGETEVWEIVNLTADAHPIHLHLVQFQLMNRQKFDLKKYDALYNASFPSGIYEPAAGPPLAYAGPATDPVTGGSPWNCSLAGAVCGGNPDVTPFLKGPVQPPNAHENGWKDTVVMYPGQVTRIAVRWAPTDVPVSTVGSFPFDPNGGHGYVWHCHIIDHEDNEMMRPDSVQPNLAPAARTFTDY